MNKETTLAILNLLLDLAIKDCDLKKIRKEIKALAKDVREIPEQKQDSSPHKQFIEMYYAIFKNTFHVKPTISGRDAGTVTRIIKEMPDKKEQQEFIVYYLSLKDKFIQEKGYQLCFSEQYINSFRMQGKKETQELVFEYNV